MVSKKFIKRWRKFLILGILNLILLMNIVSALTDIATCSALQGMNLNLGENYRLIKDIDCNAINFISIGDNSHHFTGTLDGQGYKIYGLHIDEFNQDYVGLIGYLHSGAKIKNIVLIVNMTQGRKYVGTLVGKSDGVIENCKVYMGSMFNGVRGVKGRADLGDWTGMYVGGLVGYSSGTINNCSVNVNVNSYGTNSYGPANYGGLVGHLENGEIYNANSKGNVDGGSDGAAIGGLVGYSIGSSKRIFIQNSYATGNVEGDKSLGGLVGYVNNMEINNSYATGNVYGTSSASSSYIGGLVGAIPSGSSPTYYRIRNSFAIGDVSHFGNYGELVGSWNECSSSKIINSFYYNRNMNRNCGTAENGGISAFYSSTHPVYTGTPPWDFTKIWNIDNGIGLPYLESEKYCGDGICRSYESYCTCAIDCGAPPGTPISDTSTNANNGNVYCASSVAGRVGNAFSFNGASGYVSIPDSSSLRPADKLSISAWVKFNAYPADKKFEFIVEKNLGGTWASYGMWMNSSGNLIFSVENKQLNAYPVWATAPLNLNQWYHVVGVFNKANNNYLDGKIYIDGSIVSTSFIANGYASNFAIGYDSGNLNIGREGGTINSNFMNGIIDEVKIWNIALSESQILSLYENNNINFNTCTLGQTKTIENSNMQINCLNTKKIVSGNDLIMNWALILKNTLAYGLYPLYGYAKDSVNAEVSRQIGNISFVAFGSPMNRTPALLPLTPNTGESYPNQEVNFSYGCSDADGFNDLISCELLIFSSEISSFLVPLYYYPEDNTFNLANETNNSVIVGTCTPGANILIENRNAKINCSKIILITSGTNLSLKVPVSFKENLAGKSYSVGLYVRDHIHPGLLTVPGSWTVKNIVVVNSPPTADSINPSSGEFFTDEENTFTASYSDPNGYTDLSSLYLVIDSNLSDTQKVLTVYYPTSRKIELRNNLNNSNVDGNCTIGENKTLNSYYTNISCWNSGTSSSGITTNVNLDFIFNEKFIGQRKLFIRAVDENGSSSNWNRVGNITIEKRIPRNCTDSDGGKDYSKKGIVNGTNGLFTDSCSNTTTLKEYYCNNYGNGAFVYYKCPGKCSNSTCVEIKTTPATKTTDEPDKSEVYASTEPSTTEGETEPVQGKTAGEIVLWAIIWIIIVIFCIVLIYLIISLSKKRALRKKFLSKVSTPIIRQMPPPPRYFRPGFRR